MLVASSGGFDRSSGIDPLLGQTLAGRYQILRKIGEGGMGIVYEAVHVVIEKRVALKVLREDFSHRPDVVERFRQEAKSASRIGHEHIIDISDFGVTPSGAHFFVMELLHGCDLAEELERRGALPARRAIEIVLQCTRALGAAHAKGIVHRDMKPENVFLMQRDTGEDFVKIVDFGIAKMSDIETGGPGKRLTKTGMIFGTPEYMSPEQAGGKELDHRVDVYALGVILYELVTGRVPFVGDTFMGILTQHMFEQVPPLRVTNPGCSAPPELEATIRKAMAKSADERQRSMDELGAELSSLLQRMSITSSVPPPGTITHVERAAQLTRPAPFVDQRLEQRPDQPWAAHDFHDERAGRSRPRGPLWFAIAASLLLAVGAFALLRASDTTEPTVRTERAAVTVPAAAPEPSPLPVAPPPVAPPPAAEQPTAQPVTVEVSTEPKGASVLIDGRTACEPTPCRFETERGNLLKIAAQKSGYRSGSLELSPSRDLNQVQIVLRPRSRTPAGVRMEGDLMLPDAFGKR
jgi:serine/threonine-protein kinase